MALPITEGRNQKEGGIWHWSLGKEDLKHIKLEKKKRKGSKTLPKWGNKLETHLKLT